MFTPKQRTERALATIVVRPRVYTGVRASDVFRSLVRHYLPDVRIDLYWPEDFADPPVSLRFGGETLRCALEHVAMRCGVEMTVNDYGSIVLQQPTVVAARRHTVVVEPPPFDRWEQVIRKEE